MERSLPSQGGAFQVYLRLRPPLNESKDSLRLPERCLTVEPPSDSESYSEDEQSQSLPTHITLQPPNDARKRAVEMFAFTKIFEEHAGQLEVFEEIGMGAIMRGVLGEGRDGLVATLGVTGSGKSHTILGSKSQRGITQMTLDVLFHSLAENLRQSTDSHILNSIAASDPSEAQILSAATFIESVFGDGGRSSRAQTPGSRSQTPMVGAPQTPQEPVPPVPAHVHILHPTSLGLYPRMLGLGTGSPNQKSKGKKAGDDVPVYQDAEASLSPVKSRITRAAAKLHFSSVKDSIAITNVPQRKNLLPRPSALPQLPDVSSQIIPVESDAQFAVVISMYEVYNDRIFDLLTPGPQKPTTKNPTQGRRALLFKPTENSPDRKIVAGLRKIVCGSYEEALMVLETGLTERKVTGTGANSVSSRSHGFFCLEVKQRVGSGYGEEWKSTNLTIVDLAGSERARTAKTAGATLAEAGKINESLMYLGQCLQMQINSTEGSKPNLVPFRQCKLTELLFSNSFPQSGYTRSGPPPQKAIMIVTADPLGDYNATSQILRYSALAREVTVPRIPSVSSQILSGTIKAGNGGGAGSRVASAQSQSDSEHEREHQTISNEELDLAISEINRLNEQVEFFAIRLAEEEIRRENVELELRVAQERCDDIETRVREEVWAETEEVLESERRRWRAALDEERERSEEKLDSKLELLGRGVQVLADPAEERCEELEFENAALRQKLEALERELQNRASPTKKSRTKIVLGENMDERSSGQRSPASGSVASPKRSGKLMPAPALGFPVSRMNRETEIDGVRQSPSSHSQRPLAQNDVALATAALKAMSFDDSISSTDYSQDEQEQQERDPETETEISALPISETSGLESDSSAKENKAVFMGSMMSQLNIAANILPSSPKTKTKTKALGLGSAFDEDKPKRLLSPKKKTGNATMNMKTPLKVKKSAVAGVNANGEIDAEATPRRVRKLVGRKWDEGFDEDF